MEPTPAPEAPQPQPQPPKKLLQGRRLSSGILAGGAAFAMTLAGLGIASAQTDDATPTTTGPGGAAEAPEDGVAPHRHRAHHPVAARMAVVAEALGLTPAELKAEFEAGKSIATIAGERGVAVDTVVAKLVADAKEQLAQAVSSGRLTQEQADARAATLEQRMTEVVNRDRPVGDGKPGGGHHRHPHVAEPKVIAAALGLTPEELRTELQAGKSIATIAGERGVAVDTVIAKLVADAKAHLAQAVTDGKLTQAQADERSANLEARITELVNRTGPFGPGPGEEGGRRGPGGPGGHGAKPDLGVAAGVLGLTPEELRTELQAGKSLATIAGERDVEVSKVVEALVADAKARLAQAVTDGKLTQAQADERSANLEARITDLVNRTGRPHGHGHGHRGPGGDAPAGAEPAAFTA